MTHEPKSNAFSIPVRIYYEDTDAGGVVYYANYLKYLERCRSEWLRHGGLEQNELLHGPGIVFVVRSVNVEYLKPARLDDLLTVGMEVERITRAQVFFRQTIRRGDETLVTAQVQVVCVNAALMKIVSLPAALRIQLESMQ